MTPDEVTNLLVRMKSKLNEAFPEGWFLSGSTYLVANKYIYRDIHDIDIMTVGDHYGDGGCRGIIGGEYSMSSHSSKFRDDDGNLIKCFKMKLGVISIDFMFNPSANQHNVLDQIIKYKLRAVNDEYCCIDSRIKHLEDLEELVHYCNENCPAEIKANNLSILLSKYKVFDLVHSESQLSEIRSRGINKMHRINRNLIPTY